VDWLDSRGKRACIASPLPQVPGLGTPRGQAVTKRANAATRYPAVCDATKYKRGCMCEKCRAHDTALTREEREQRVKEGLSYGQ
jgi:hypothetical protein